MRRCVCVLIVLLSGLFQQAQAKAPHVRLDWDAYLYPCDAFVVQRASGSHAYVTLGELPCTQLTYNDTTIQPGQSYRYVVRVRRGTALSDPSNEVVVRVPPPPRSRPSRKRPR
jgi:hypothetical protein